MAWMGFGRSRGKDFTRLSDLAEQLRAVSPGSRSEVLASVAEFLDTHDLPVSQDVLTVAYDYVTEADLLLVKLIDQRLRADQPITTEWLKKLQGTTHRDNGSAEMQRTFEKLQKQLIDFSAMAGEARRATQDYGVSLEGHAKQLGGKDVIKASAEEILGVVRAMIHRTSDIEREMAKSEKRSQELRENLEEALRFAEEDDLTGVPNRRAFQRVFEQEYTNARDASEPLVVAFCDIDNFKKINDTHGHDAGDRVLRAVARALTQMVNDNCFLARHGGEEFVVLFRAKTLDEASVVLNNVRRELSERRFIDHKTDAPIGYVTFSAGVADVFKYSDCSSALKAADTALYMAKENGRNQIAVAE